MGVIGGLQVLRAYNKTILIDAYSGKSLCYFVFPWHLKSKHLTILSGRSKSNRAVMGDSVTAKMWSRIVDFNACVYVGLLLSLATITFNLNVGDQTVLISKGKYPLHLVTESN